MVHNDEVIVSNVHTIMDSLSSASFLLSKIIPVDISSDDSILRQIPDPNVPVPNVDINELDGGDNLGTLLWAFSLFNGIFVTKGRPGDWTLDLIAKIVQQEEEEWYKDYIDGYKYQCPPLVDAIRFLFFLFLGYYANKLWVESLGGDSFWGWSTGACLAIPSGFFNLARDKRITRTEQQFQNMIQESIEKYLKKRVQPRLSITSNEEVIISAFRRSSVDFRDKEMLPDKMLKKMIRTVLNRKPDKLGDYKNLYFSEVDLETQAALSRALAITKQQKEELAREQSERLMKGTEAGRVVEEIPDTIGKDFVR
eukprot:CAMPEP_0182429312 /NCGR_PEP_ID=MMETSP1167-20130531/25678_1 /TAXON_ID=2988 /ORGANISM="Mallomonas Sp, Strain CCMP3275" /LENGTH=309 /DNA_ID=CAMNT_0024612755 /DNA_START=293 /DNA_END=1222 /DNA_ORIENTATION=-